MFKNIGRKLKKFAKFVTIAGMIVGVILGVTGILTSESVEGSVSGWMFLISGTFMPLVYGMLMYAFGELIETNQKMYGLMLRGTDGDTLKTPIQEGTWTCGACWNINPRNSAECAKCGAPRK